MLLFRDEEHVDSWCRAWHMTIGAVLSLEQAWRLARVWFAADRSAPDWRRLPREQVEALFASLGLTGRFWSLR